MRFFSSLHSYFSATAAFRHFRHNRLYFFINITGLSLGVACVLLAVLFARHESGYDQFHQKKDNLYRVITTVADSKGERRPAAGTGQPQGPAFKAAVPEIIDYARLMGGDIRGTLKGNNKSIDLQMLFVDSSFFNLFSFPMLKGDTATALKTINSVVITETIARKFFNKTDVVGEFLYQDADPSEKKLGKPLVIGGVVKDLPDNSSVRFDVLFPLAYMQLSFTDDNWLNQYLGTFLLLKENADKNAIVEKFNRVYETHAKAQVEESKKLYHYDPQIKYDLQNVTAMHLNPMLTGSFREGGIINESSPVSLYLFLGISIFILVMAGINFINISIAGSLKRAKEVGIRKISGGNKQQIIFQFLFESAIVCSIALVTALLISKIALPLFNELSGKQFTFSDLVNIDFAGWLLLILVVLVAFTGFYPAYVLSDFKPREVLYNKQKLSGKNFFGRALIVFQFAMAVFFISVTLIYYTQMEYIRTKDLGYDPTQILRTNIPGDREYQSIKSALRTRLSREPSIKYLSFGSDNSNYEAVVGNQTLNTEYQSIDEFRIPVMGLRLKAGRNLSPEFPTDNKGAAVVNEAFVKAAGLTNPLGTQIQTDEYYNKETRTIIGVVEDFHYGSLHEPVKPLVMLVCDWNSGGIWIKVDKQNQQKAIKAVDAAFAEIMPGALFQYKFIDELNASSYVREQRWQKIIFISTIISIIICCIGLFGLAHLSTQRRAREIGIRKILGAGISGIVGLLTKDFVKLVFISIVLATPLAWLVMSRWMENFAYRASISSWIFVLSAILVISITIITVGLQTIKAAMVNPVNSLREE